MPVNSSAAAAAAKSLQLCLTLCDPIDGVPPGNGETPNAPLCMGIGCIKPMAS